MNASTRVKNRLSFMRRLSRLGLRFGTALAVFVLSQAGNLQKARAEDSGRECAADAYNGQALRDEGKLTEARAKFLQCANPRCPAFVATDCTRWLFEIDARLPTIALGARDPEGRDLQNVRVLIDRILAAELLDGRAIPVNPGRHTIRFEADGFAPVEQTLVLLEGQKGRTLSVVLGASPGSVQLGGDASTRPTTRAPSSFPLWPALVAGGVGAVGMGAFAALGLSGQSERDHLAETCAPSLTCDPSDISAARTKLLVADISLGVSVVSFGAAAYFLVRHVNGFTATPARARTGSGVGFDFATTKDSVGGVVRGSF